MKEEPIAADRPLSRAEGAEDYADVVLALTTCYRIIECSAGIQWIIQRRVSADGATTAQWRGLSYHRNRGSLLAALVSLKIDLSADQRKVLDALPAWLHEARR